MRAGGGREAAAWACATLLWLGGVGALAPKAVVISSSMEPALLVGDHLLIDRLAYAGGGAGPPFRAVARGDVVAFRDPLEPRRLLVKRVAGVAGDRLRLRGGRLWVDGRPVVEPWARRASGFDEPYRDEFPAGRPLPPLFEPARRMLREHVRGGELVVPAGSLFVLGDNRDVSLDSRYWGLVPRGAVVGRAVLVWWSFDAPAEHLRGGVSGAHLADVARHWRTKTRWERTPRWIGR